MNNSLKILFTGDIFIKNTFSTILSEELKAIVKSHQLAVCNFEGALETEGTKHIQKAGPHIKQNSRSSEIVIDEGFNIISLANNHIYDYGDRALKNTLNSFDKVITIGAGVDFESAYKSKFFTENNTKTGFLSFCESEFGVLTDISQKRGGAAWINHHSVNDIIKEAKSQCDVLIVFVHAGIEQIEYPLPEWRQRFYELTDNGADAIIGCHVHVPQGWELYNGKPIFYSLGNFFFDMSVNHPYWNKGYCVSLNIQDKKINDFQIIPIAKKENKVYLENNITYKNHLDNLCKILNSPNYIDNINKLSVELWEKRYKRYYIEAMGWMYYRFSWKDIFSVIKNKFLNKEFPITPVFSFNNSLILHNIKIESHRWLVIRALTLLNKENDF